MSSVKRFFLILFAGVVTIILQGTVLKPLLPAILVPNLLIVLVVLLAFHEVSVFGVILAFLLGLELDIYTGLLLGPWAGSFVAAYLVFSTFSQRLFLESAFAAGFIVALASVLSNLVYLILVFEFSPVRAAAFWEVLTEALVSGICAPPVVYVLRKFLKRKERPTGIRLRAARV